MGGDEEAVGELPGVKGVDVWDQRIKASSQFWRQGFVMAVGEVQCCLERKEVNNDAI